MSLTELSCIKSFNGKQFRFKHPSSTCQCEMTFSIFLPEGCFEETISKKPVSSKAPGSSKKPSSSTARDQKKVPLLYWLSGLTCTDENFVMKAGAQAHANKHGLAIIAPDTSPRGEGVPDDPQGAYDFGLGAGFYVNATEPPFNQHYQMYDYITKELPALIHQSFPVNPERAGIFGHSMGGHGAITIALQNSSYYKSVSAFAPISSSINCPWGEKALTGYLGTDRENWHRHDASHLIKEVRHQLPLLVDQGTKDTFLSEQLKPELLEQAAAKSNYPLQLRYQEGYDHSYFFIASFMEDHINHHAKYLTL